MRPDHRRLDFKAPAPERQITDLLQFISVIDPAGIDTVETKPAGTGAYMLAERVVGQRITLTANPNYWRQGEPVTKDVVITIFCEDAAATRRARIRRRRHHLWRHARAAPSRLKQAGYQVLARARDRWCRCSASTRRAARSRTRSSARPSTT